MILSQKSKISNFCEPCKNRDRNKEGKLICTLTNNTPKISNTCRKHTYDPNLEIVLKKHLLEKGHKQNTLSDLLDPDYNESIETIHPSSKKVFNYSLTSRFFTFALTPL